MMNTVQAFALSTISIDILAEAFSSRDQRCECQMNIEKNKFPIHHCKVLQLKYRRSNEICVGCINTNGRWSTEP